MNGGRLHRTGGPLWWGVALRELREAKGLTVAEAARRAEITWKTWWYVEQGRAIPRLDIFEKMVAAVDAEVDIVQP